MLKRQARERRDYLYRRALILREAETATRRGQLRAALASGKAPADHSIIKDKQLQTDFRYDASATPARAGGKVEETAEALAGLDDEYAALSGIARPQIVVTTSRSPSPRLSAFAKEVRLLLAPAASRVNRGSTVLPALTAGARAQGLTDVVVVHEHRGEPRVLTVSHLPHGPTLRFSLHGVMLRRDLAPEQRGGAVSERAPRLVFDGFTTRLGRRVMTALRHLFEPQDFRSGPDGAGGADGASAGGFRKRERDREGRIVTFANRGDAIELRHHVYVRIPGPGKDGDGSGTVELAEIGPRMTMRLFEIRLGTVENQDGDVEWRLSQFTRTARKKNYL